VPSPLAGDNRSWRRLCRRWVAAPAVTVMLLGAPHAASAEFGSGALLVGIGVGGGGRDLLSIADVRPAWHGQAVADLEVQYLLRKRWAVAIEGRAAGSWFDFRQTLGASGNIKDQDLALRAMLDHRTRAAFVGVGVEYGQARSFTYTRFYDDEGPRTYFLGGALRVGLAHEIHPRVQVHGEITETVFRAHARDASTGSSYSWLGTCSSITLGVRLALLTSRAK